MPKVRWWLPLGAGGAALIYLSLKKGWLGQVVTNLRTFSAPTSDLYDRFVGTALERFYGDVASSIAATLPRGRLLEVGSGPGRLAVHLAQAAPELSITALDLSPDMVERARARVAEAGVADRVEVKQGDVTDLPFPDGQFDAVVSTLSLHHWSDPMRGLGEIHRVLAPGGQVWIYDLPAWLWRVTYFGPDLSELVKSSPFGGGGYESIHVPPGIPVLRRVSLAKAKAWNLSPEKPAWHLT